MKKQLEGQLSFDVVVETQVKTTDNKIVTQISLFNLPETEHFTTTDINEFIEVVEADNKDVVILINNDITTTITKKAYNDSYVIKSVKGEQMIVKELDSFTFKRNFYFYI